MQLLCTRPVMLLLPPHTLQSTHSCVGRCCKIRNLNKLCMCLLDYSLHGNSHCSRFALSNRLCMRENGNVLKFEVEKIGSTGVFQCACVYILNRTTPQVSSCIYFRFVAEIRLSLRVNTPLGGHAWRNPIFFFDSFNEP